MTLVTAEQYEHPTIAYRLIDHDGRILASRGAGEQVYAASTIKLAILLAVLRRVDAGELGLDDPLVATRTSVGRDGREFTLVGDNLDPLFPADGTPMTVGTTLEWMIFRSANEATNMAIDLVGFERIDAAIALMGLEQTQVGRKIGDYAPEEQGLSLRTSAADLASMLRQIAMGAHLSADAAAFARAALERQEFAPISEALPAGTRWGSKSGWIDGIKHDVAYIGDPATSEVRYLAVLTRGIEDAAADEIIRALTTALLGL